MIGLVLMKKKVHVIRNQSYMDVKEFGSNINSDCP